MIFAIIVSVLILLYAFYLLNTASWDISGFPQVFLAYGIFFGLMLFWIGYSAKSFIK